MFAIERLNRIKEILFQEKRVDVFELSAMFSVTEVTIRRDLDKLEQDGFLTKTYGGAVLNEKLFGNSLKQDFQENTSEDERMIGKIAAKLIDNGDSIYLGAGATCLEVARNLENKRLTVVTNDLLIAYELRSSTGIKVIVTGGDLVQSTSTLVGGFALHALSGIFINKAFLDVKGINFNSGYTVDSYEEVMIIEEVRKKSNELIVVADHTKFSKTAFARLGDLMMAKKVVTNKQVPAAFKRFYFENNIKLYTAYELE